MKIGFVAEPYEESNASGMGYVVLELLTNMIAEGSQHTFVVYSSRPIDRNLIPGKFENVIIPRGFAKQFFYFLRLKDDINVLYFIAPLLPLLIPKRIKAIVVCQELASQKITPGPLYEKIKAFLRDRILMPLCLSRAVAIGAASKATQTDILKFYNVLPMKVQVIYDGFQDVGRFKDAAPNVDEAMKPYFFFAGKVKYRKNVHGIVAAFIAFKRKTTANHKLVIAGDYGGDYYDGIMQQLSENKLEHDVFFVGYVSGAGLYSYYKNAAAFVFPSINEGFGMPPIEAMSLGTPVITSKISSMAEVAGDAALLVDPFSVEEISSAMERITHDDALRAELVQKGFERCKMFSWKKAAQSFLSLAEAT